MSLTTTAKEYGRKVSEVSELAKRKLGEMVIDADVEAEDLKLLKSMFEMIELSNQLICEQATAIQEINEKLDKLMVK